MIGTLIVLSLFAAQLLRIQGFDSDAVASAALEQRTSTEVIPAERGTILDDDGVVLAQSHERRTIVVDQQAVKTYEKEVHGTSKQVGAKGAARDVARLLDDVDRKDLVKKMTGNSRYQVLVKDISPLTWRKISDLGIPGLYSERTTKRTYPQSTTVASLVGFVQPQDQSAGAGLELQFDDILKGEPGKATYEISQNGSRLPNASDEVQPAEPGRDVKLTIDNDVQWYAQNALAEEVKKTKALSGTVVVQRVDTGELVALASYPTFDPNKLENDEVYANLAFSDVFEPGSTAKVLTVAAALQEGTIEPDTPMILPGQMERGNRILKDSHPHPDEYRTVAGALAESSNTGMMLIGETMKPKTLEEYMRRFGLGAKSGSGFPGESAGLLPPAETWNGSQRYTVTYGQGVSTTAVQVTNVFQAIANDGVRIAPSFVDQVSDGEGGWKEGPEPETTRAVSAKSARQLSRMMEGVVSENGTAPKAQIDGYRVAGKTGTADRYDSEVGGYSGKTASFIGFAPADDPELVTSVILQRPIKGYYGGDVAAPVFKDVMTYALKAEEVPPTPKDQTRPKVRTDLPKKPDPDTPGLLSDTKGEG